uniref:Uncharacterized protein n=1 Tax=Oryza glumipatula TaxID=40148 RepID=A0A0D9ZUM4_9ORYZ
MKMMPNVRANACMSILKLICAEKFEDVVCSDNDFAKVLAVLAGLDKCEELGYGDVELWSDSQRACGVLSGSETINMDDRNRTTDSTS